MTLYYDETNKRFIGQITINNKRKSFYGKTEKEVLLKINEFKMNDEPKFKSKTLTLFDWSLEWFDTYKVNDFKRATFEKEKRRLMTIINDELGQLYLNEIKTIDIQNYINRLSKTLSPKTIKNYIILLNGSLKKATQNGLIDFNPCESVSLPKLVRPDMVALNKEEKELFLMIAKNNPYCDFFTFALNTGMRESEICGLTRDAIDLQKGFITIDKQLVKLKGRYILDTPKTNQSIRKIPITLNAKNILLKYLSENVLKDYVFFNPKNHSILKQNTLCENIRKVYNECYQITKNEKFLKATFHTLRHTFATSWIIQGGNVTLLSKALGHTDASFTIRVYVQPDFEDVQKEMYKLNF